MRDCAGDWAICVHNVHSRTQVFFCGWKAPQGAHRALCVRCGTTPPAVPVASGNGVQERTRGQEGFPLNSLLPAAWLVASDSDHCSTFLHPNLAFVVLAI